jgi:hypothetical protein
LSLGYECCWRAGYLPCTGETIVRRAIFPTIRECFMTWQQTPAHRVAVEDPARTLTQICQKNEIE